MLRAAKKTAENIRFVGRVPGRYTFPDYRAESGLETFACITQGVTPRNAAVSAPLVADLGERVSANFDNIGVVHGHVTRFVEGGFAMDFDPDSNNLEKLAERIKWVKKMKVFGVADSREHRRVLPRDPQSTLLLADGHQVKCFIVDMSASGVAISADYHPPLDTRLAVGSVVGSVVRHLKVGFAVKFTETQSLDTIEELLTKLPVSQSRSTFAAA